MLQRVFPVHPARPSHFGCVCLAVLTVLGKKTYVVLNTGAFWSQKLTSVASFGLKIELLGVYSYSFSNSVGLEQNRS